MATNLVGAFASVGRLLATAPAPAAKSTEVNSHTFIGLGFMAFVIFVVWLIRRLRSATGARRSRS